MPSLHSPSVATIEASASISARWAKKAGGWAPQTSRRATLMASWRSITSSGSKRRQKSPAVVGSGRLSTPRPSRNTASHRLASMSSRLVPPHRAL